MESQHIDTSSELISSETPPINIKDGYYSRMLDEFKNSFDVEHNLPRTKTQDQITQSSKISPKIYPRFASPDSFLQRKPIDLNQDDLIMKIKESINHHELLIKAKKQLGTDVTQLEKLVNELRMQLKSLIHNKDKSIMRFQSIGLINLKKTFKFYARQQKLLGKAPSFERISNQVSFLNKGKFVAFLRDYGLIATHRKRDRRIFTAKEVGKIFDKITNFEKLMDTAQFEKAVNQLAQQFYNEQYDQINGTSFREKKHDEKFSMFLNYINQTSKLDFKSMGLWRNFGGEPGRLPSNDLAKRYIYNDPKRLYRSQEKLPTWAYTKEVMPTNSPSISYISNNSRSSAAIFNGQGKSLRRRIMQQQKTVVPKDHLSEAITWESLKSSKLDKFKTIENEVKDLIVDDSSEDEILRNALRPSAKASRSRKRILKNETTELQGRHSDRKHGIIPRIPKITFPNLTSRSPSSEMPTSERATHLLKIAERNYKPEAAGRRALLRALSS